MMIVGEKIIKPIDSKDAKLDSTPLEASRYDYFENHANIWYKLKAKPLISLPIDAVINEEGEVEREGCKRTRSYYKTFSL